MKKEFSTPQTETYAINNEQKPGINMEKHFNNMQKRQEYKVNWLKLIEMYLGDGNTKTHLRYHNNFCGKNLN